MTTDQTFVIVGASLAGAKAAETLREEGFDGRLVLLGAEPERPVRAPAAVQGLPARRGRAREGLRPRRGLLRRARDRAATRRAPWSTLDRRRARGRARRRRAAALRPAAADHRRRAAPAADSRAASSTASTTCARSPTATRCARASTRGGTLVVVGAGWIGARSPPPRASAASRSRSSTRIAVPLERVLGPEVGAFYRDIHLDHGVELLLGDRRRGASRATARSSASAPSDGRIDRLRLRRRRHRRHAARRARRAAPASRSTTASSSTSACRPARPGVFAAGDVANALHPVLRRAHPRRALGQRAAPGAGGGARRCSASRAATTGCRTSSPTSTTSAWSTPGYAPAGIEVVFRGDPATPRVHRLLAARAARRWPG